MAVTGKGAWPNISSWAFGPTGLHLARKQVGWPRNDPAFAAMWQDWFFQSGTGPSYYGVLKRWTGSAWAPEPLKTWLGGTWQAKPLKRWDGTAWRLVNTTGV